MVADRCGCAWVDGLVSVVVIALYGKWSTDFGQEVDYVGCCCDQEWDLVRAWV